MLRSCRVDECSICMKQAKILCSKELEWAESTHLWRTFRIKSAFTRFETIYFDTWPEVDTFLWNCDSFCNRHIWHYLVIGKWSPGTKSIHNENVLTSNVNKGRFYRHPFITYNWVVKFPRHCQIPHQKWIYDDLWKQMTRVIITHFFKLGWFAQMNDICAD